MYLGVHVSKPLTNDGVLFFNLCMGNSRWQQAHLPYMEALLRHAGEHMMYNSLDAFLRNIQARWLQQWLRTPELQLQWAVELAMSTKASPGHQAKDLVWTPFFIATVMLGAAQESSSVIGRSSSLPHLAVALTMSTSSIPSPDLGCRVNNLV
jgi:hypothetical protein